MERVTSVTETQRHLTGLDGGELAGGTEEPKAWGYLWWVTEMILRLLTNGRWGAPPATWLTLVYYISLAYIQGILRTVALVLSPLSYGRSQFGHEGSAVVPTPHRS